MNDAIKRFVRQNAGQDLKVTNYFTTLQGDLP